MDSVQLVLSLTIVLLLASPSTAQDQAFDSAVCTEAPETGNCRMSLHMWFHNSTSGVCEEFIWGGCRGSLNKFRTRLDCIRSCTPETCALTPKVGSCRAMIRAWFYDAESRVCKQFIYGGCEGNENRFDTQHDCETACAGTNLLCNLGSKFETIGYQSVVANHREEESFNYSCERRCRQLCIGDHSWGTCFAFSIKKRWYTCECYLFDRFLSEQEFVHGTSGTTRNRKCEGDASQGDE